MTDDMAHLNRRMTDDDDGKRHRMLEAVESTQAKIISRVLVPVLLAGLLAVSGFVGKRLLRQLDTQGSDIAQVKSDVRVLSTRFDEVTLRQVESHASHIDALEKKDVDQDRRIDALERTVRVQ